MLGWCFYPFTEVRARPGEHFHDDEAHLLLPPVMREHDTQLIDACRHGRLADVTTLLASGADVNERKTDETRATPLYIAAQEGHVEVVSTLLAAGASVVQTIIGGSTPLLMASERGHVEVVKALLAGGVAVDQAATDSARPLLMASQVGHAEVVSVLLAAGAAADQANRIGGTSLMAASQHGHAEVVSTLLAAGSAVDQANQTGARPMSLACHNGHLPCVQLLSSYGAARTMQAPDGQPFTAEQCAAGHAAVAAWLGDSRQWSTPLHHLRIIGRERARELLRGGADLHAAAAVGGPTPLSLAQALRAAGDAAEGSAAWLVLAAAEPWGPRTHALFPAAGRAFAVEALLLGHQLSRLSHFEGKEGSVVDVWMEVVMPSVVMR